MAAKKLNLILSGDTSTPLYQQIKNAITEKISSGEWQAGQLIPSENQLAKDLGASRMTINRPLRELAAEGLLRRVHGLGTFVAEPPRQAQLIEIRSIADEIKLHGKTHRAQVLSSKTVKAGAEIGRHMKVEQSSALFQVILIHFQDEVPIQLESRHVNPILAPGFLDVDFTVTTPTEYLISQIRPDEIEHIVQAIAPDAFVATQLKIPLAEPCLKLRRRTWKNGLVVTAADLIYPSSRYDLGARYTPSTKT